MSPTDTHTYPETNENRRTNKHPTHHPKQTKIEAKIKIKKGLVQLEHWLGVVRDVDLVVRLRDRRVAMAGRRVVRAQLAVRWTHHLTNGKKTLIDVTWRRHISGKKKRLVKQ